ncbi:MAG: site-2 protease family protein [Microthrixaceae bacterium]
MAGDQGSTGHGTTAARVTGQGAGAGAGDPVVIRTDPAPTRLLTAWRRAGSAEGRRTEFHPGRALLLAGAVVALAWFLPGAAVFLGMLAVIIVIHEAGHYVVALRCGMRPTEFFVGFGPTVWSRHTSGGSLRWGLKAFPLGGYVKIPGMGPREEVEASLEPYTYRAAARPRRMAVILAGSVANLALGVTLFFGFAMTNPDIHASAGRAATGSVSLAWDVGTDTLAGLGSLVTGAGDYAGAVADGRPPEQRMVSAVGGAQLTDGLLSEHPSRLLLLAGLFSVSIAVLNLLPLLPLDGGHAAVILAEGTVARVRRRPGYRLDPNRFRPVAVAVIVVLVALGVSSMWVDLLHPLNVALG